jgi:uncharacterized membrane protein
MDATVSEWLNLIFRWIHVIAGVMWIGHLWYFNFVNSQVAKTYDADSKKKVLPEVMPRALYWFRWGAMYTLITGILLLGVVYYMGGITLPAYGAGISAGIGLGLLVISFVIYDILWKSPLFKNEMVGAVVSFVAVVAIAFGLTRVFPGRGVFMHIGAMFGFIMAANVWMRIWPGQRKIIAGVKGTAPAPDPSVPAIAGLRSKHNTYMSVPLIFFMVSNHFPTVYGSEMNWIFAAGFVAVGWGLTKLMYQKAATPAPAAF